MPRKLDPSKIKTGTGLAPSDSIEGNAFVGTSITGADSNTLGAHLNDPTDAHDASAISIDGVPTGIFETDNVEGALDELSGLVPPRPPTIGNKKTYMSFTGVPDWGVLKLGDAGLVERGILSSSILSPYIYPYYHEYTQAFWVDQPTPRGNDIQSDSIFNVEDATYRGGGLGKTFAGGFNRNNTHTIESFNLYETTGSAREVIISGSLFPADRGTLGIFYIPEGGTINDIECLAAINCGQGILDECDGKFGGIFTIATNDDIYDYPSAATGQYDLSELHTGYVRGTDRDISSVTPSGSLAVVTCTTNHNLVAGNQVFIQGCDAVPDINGYNTIVDVTSVTEFRIMPSGVITANGTTGTVGTSLTPASFNPANADNSAGQVRLGYTILGGTTSSAAPTDVSFVDGRNDNNFFRYRLPYLENYASLIYTPENHQPRYFEKPSVSLDPSTDLTLAGNYEGFTKDYWTFQLARYRHKVELPFTSLAGEKGSLLMLHFKKETFFEDLVTDKNAPAPERLYSANLINWTNIESDLNIYNTSPEGQTTSSSAYNILKSRIYEDHSGTVAPVLSGSYLLNRTIDEVYYVSGVAYFRPHPTAGVPLRFENVAFSVSNLFDDTFRLGKCDNATEATNEMLHPDPTSLWLGSYGTNFTIPVGGHGRRNITKSSMVEIKYSLLGSFDLSNPPPAGAVGNFAAPTTAHYVVAGDETPTFCANAKIRAFAKRPLLHDSTGYIVGNTLSEFSGDTIMIHSASSTSAYRTTSMNFTSYKDTKELFLDETYRWRWDFGSAASLIASGDLSTTDEYDRLFGAGLPTVGVIDIPVQVSLGGAFVPASFRYMGDHEIPLDATRLEAQVAGFPDRNPPLSDGVKTAIPQSGILRYPQVDYSTGHRPSITRNDLSTYNQPDYSGLLGDRVFIRAFDLAFSRHTVPLPEAIGSTFFKIRIHGVELEDFAWAGGATSGSDGLAIFVKLAGLTTWMDIGRLDGSGPSKQDAFSDGAGCQVNDPTETKNGVNPDTGIVFADVLIHTGTSASIYENSFGEAPILVKVVIKDSSAGRDLNFEQGGSVSSVQYIRGLTGIEIIRPE